MAGLPTNITTATTTEVTDKRNAVLENITVNTAEASATITIYDNVAAGVGGADADGICQSQTPAGGGVQALTINGALSSGGVATLGYNRKVTITSAGNDSGRTFTITGTDENDTVITEDITGPNTTTVTGTKDFKTVIDVDVDDNTAGAITVGAAASTGDVVGTITMPSTLLQNHFTLPYNTGLRFGCTIVTTGTPNITVTVS